MASLEKISTEHKCSASFFKSCDKKDAKQSLCMLHSLRENKLKKFFKFICSTNKNFLVNLRLQSEHLGPRRDLRGLVNYSKF